MGNVFIIVDDCSSDKSVSIVEKFQEKDGRIQLLKNKSNMGMKELLLEEIELLMQASGDIIAFLDSDDIWHPEKLSKHLVILWKKIHQFFLIHLMVLLMKIIQRNYKINISCRSMSPTLIIKRLLKRKLK